ncbi:hypothetical protein J5X84_24380 [Streptosporangiaceae bacterium NEAU-GS5]|nr:hypothetical protein [Streptosporangiaceae bacterium NEAU-GS5]
MRHPSDGTLRRLLDEPVGVADADREHVAGCPVCLSGLAAAEQDAAVATAALNAEFAADVDGGWSRLSQAVEDRKPARMPRAWRRTRLRSPVVAIFGVVVLLTGIGAAAATDWLQIFRTEQIAPVTAPEADLITLPDLSDFGAIQVTEKVHSHTVADADAARQATGLAAPAVGRLPHGVTGRPSYFVVDRVSAVFTFSAAKTAQMVARAGRTPPPAPPGLDGSKFRLVAGPVLAATWSAGRPVPALIVARAVAPTAYSSGVPYATARDYLLSLHVLPENVAAQLRGFSGEGTTLPLFATLEQSTHPADVGGTPATVLTSRDGTMAGVIWTDDGYVCAVAGSLRPDELLSVARGLRWDQ